MQNTGKSRVNRQAEEGAVTETARDFGGSVYPSDESVTDFGIGDRSALRPLVVI
jgi:hypothetical protein